MDKNRIYIVDDDIEWIKVISLFLNSFDDMLVVCTSSDNGKGISKNMLSKVFDPFFSTKPSKNNFGLGLTFCYNVIQKHCGVIDIESEENKGTKIIIMLPVCH